MRRQVVITGLGVVSPFGEGADALWEGLLQGRCAIGPITRLDASAFPCQLAGEVPPDVLVKKRVPKAHRKAVKVMARDTELAVIAAHEAALDAGLATPGVEVEGPPAHPPHRLGCQIGAGLIACETNELTQALVTALDERTGEVSLRAWGEQGMGNLTPLWLLKYLPNMLACHVTIIHNAQGPSNTITCAEASGLLSAAEAVRVIRRGAADACFAGGAESKLNHMGLVRMDFAGRLAHVRTDAPPEQVVRPYDPTAAGSVLCEMGGIAVLEAEETARQRGARVYARVAGVGAGQSLGADPATRAKGLSRAIRAALADANTPPEAVDVIVPHASGVAAVDAEEAEALRSVFGACLRNKPLITLTPNVGEAMAGAGGAALAVAALALARRTLPARIHSGAPAEDLQVGPTTAKDADLRCALVCTNSLGGHNAALVLERADA